MTTSALTGGFAVCQTRLGAKIHDPKDPGADLGPMFRQVVGTILRWPCATPTTGCRSAAATTSRPRLRADHRPAAARGEHARLAVRVPRRVAALADMWGSMLAPVPRDGHGARRRGWPAGRSRRASSASAATSHRHRRRRLRWPRRSARSTSRMTGAGRLRPRRHGPQPSSPAREPVAALVPIYFGRVGSFVIENRHITTDQAEERVERQAREFELLKPYSSSAGARGWRMSPRSPLPARILIPVANPHGRGADPLGAAMLDPRAASCRPWGSSRCPRDAAVRGRDACPARPPPPPEGPRLRASGTPIHPIVRIGRHASEGIIEASAEQEPTSSSAGAARRRSATTGETAGRQSSRRPSTRSSASRRATSPSSSSAGHVTSSASSSRSAAAARRARDPLRRRHRDVSRGDGRRAPPCRRASRWPCELQ